MFLYYVSCKFLIGTHKIYNNEKEAGLKANKETTNKKDNSFFVERTLAEIMYGCLFNLACVIFVITDFLWTNEKSYIKNNIIHMCRYIFNQGGAVTKGSSQISRTGTRQQKT